MSTMVFVEGLWHTGKSFFLNYLHDIQSDQDKFLIHKDLRSFRSVRHAAYLVFPRTYHTIDQVFDRSPITLKAISDPSLGIYDHPSISREYWTEFYNDWIEVLKDEKHKVLVLYFRPFSGGELQVFSGIQEYVQKYPKSHLMVDPAKCSAKKLTALHETYSQLILDLKRKLKKQFQYYQIEFRDTEDAIDALRYEEFLSIPSAGIDLNPPAIQEVPKIEVSQQAAAN